MNKVIAIKSIISTAPLGKLSNSIFSADSQQLKQLESFDMDYNEMHRKMYEADHEAADQTGALIG